MQKADVFRELTYTFAVRLGMRTIPDKHKFPKAKGGPVLLENLK